MRAARAWPARGAAAAQPPGPPPRLALPRSLRSAAAPPQVEFFNFHEKEPIRAFEKPLKSANLGDALGKFDTDFCEVDQAMLFELIEAANVLDAKPLLDVLCAKLATLIKGKNPQQIRETFNIQNVSAARARARAGSRLLRSSLSLIAHPRTHPPVSAREQDFTEEEYKEVMEEHKWTEEG